jgi:hypothetical protein
MIVPGSGAWDRAMQERHEEALHFLKNQHLHALPIPMKVAKDLCPDGFEEKTLGPIMRTVLGSAVHIVGIEQAHDHIFVILKAV